ncbi:M14 family zinc carboxypeptidase [Bacillus sp. EB01]|uniref:M14 family zinc carboxypeptidase n=1 Tax=Bacillus sp. EB01 TaxID=1347086 RepID=UPI0005C52309|nr:M14 family zinc carboxypeptidase [Bacillus sp. EB01]
METKRKNVKRIVGSVVLSGVLLTSSLPVNVFATEAHAERKQSLFNSEHYDYLVYDEIQGKLKEFKKSKRVNVEVTGKSSTGRNLYTVTVSSDGKTQDAEYKKLRKLMSENPEKAKEFLEENPQVKAPILIHASIHGTEFVGTDAALQLIERFAFENDQETQQILDSYTLVFNVNANPDGRIDATRFNRQGIDLNRDFITQSQPETQAVIEQITELNPLVLLDLHGYVKQRGVKNHPGLILPGTPPHNPNYEYDLQYKWMNQQAEAMEAELVSERANYQTDLYKTMEGTHIPLRDSKDGWDVYPPIYTPAYAQLHGTYGFTLEAPTNDWDGVKWQVDAVTGALNFAVENKHWMLEDQLEILNRGEENYHPNYENQSFPEAYILPVNEADPTVTEKAVQHLLNNDVEVQKANKGFTAEGKTYEAGTYIVDLNQPKASVANAFLWDGEDITNDIAAMYDISAWSLPELWGFEAVEAKSDFTVQAKRVDKVKTKGQLIGKGPYVIPNSSNAAVQLVNELVGKEIPVKRDVQGNFYVDTNRGSIEKEVKQSGLTVQSSSAGIPTEAEAITKVKVAILRDGGMGKVQSHSGVRIALERLGFDVTELHPQQVAASGLNGFDVFVYSGSANLVSFNSSTANKEFTLANEAEYNAFKENVKTFVEQNGRFIAVGAGASRVAKSLGLTEVNVNTGSSSSNGIVRVDYKGAGITAGYGGNDVGFVYGPVWYTNTTNTNVEATFAATPDFFESGHWKNREAASGQAVIVEERDRPVTLIGLEAGFRNHTDYLFRLLSNSIFDK